MHDEQVIKDIKVIGVEKPQKGKFQQHFEYVIRVIYANGHEHLIFRRYSMLFDFHSVLKEVVKDSYGNMIVLPELPVAKFQHVGRKFLRLGMNKELKQMTDFCQKIIKLPKFISEKDIILQFFAQLGTDVAHTEAYQQDSQKGDVPKDQAEIPTSDAPGGSSEASQENGGQYQSVGDFEASGTGELSVMYGEIVTVVEKNSSGWWLVSNTSGATGFTPATFLETIEDKAENEEEWIEVKGPHNIYTAVKDYEAQCPDEINFKAREEVEVISMSNFGWWKVQCHNQVGLAPASSLTLKLASESQTSGFNDPMQEFRKSVLNLSKKWSTREAPPRKNSSKSNEDEFSEPGHTYTNLQAVEPERYSPDGSPSSVKYTKIIPKHLRQEETNNNDKDNTRYVNVPVIKDGTPHYRNSLQEDPEATDVHVVRKDYEKNGFCLKEGETVQVISVMPDGCHWKVASLSPPYRDGLIPADLLCPELPSQDAKPALPSDSVMCEEDRENLEPVRVLPRFTQPPSAKKPVPKPRTTSPKSSTEISLVALTDYTPLQNEMLAFRKGDVARLIHKVDTGWWFVELEGIGGWVPAACWELVKDSNQPTHLNNSHWPKVFDKSQWFCGKMSRMQCENLFGKRGKHLDFMIRESVQRVGSYVLSIKFHEKVHHFPIEMAPSGKLNIGKLTFGQLSEIVSHYTIHPLFFTDHRQPVSIGKPLSSN